MAIVALWEFGAGGLRLGATADAGSGLESPQIYPDANGQFDPDSFTLDNGSLRVGFRQLLQMGTGEDVILCFDQGGTRLQLGVTEEGAVRLHHHTADERELFASPDEFFHPGDSVLVTHCWDFGGDTGFCRFDNLTSGTSHTLAVPGSLTLDEEALDSGAWSLGPDETSESGSFAFAGRLTHLSLHDDSDEAPEAAESDETREMVLALWEEEDECPPDDWAGHPGLVPGAEINTRTGGDGDDFMVTGPGINRLEGGAGNDTLIASAGSEDDFTVTMTFEGGTTGGQNSLGVYFVDPLTGEITDAFLAWEDASPEFGGGKLVPGSDSVSFNVPPGAQIGTFLIADGNALNDFGALGEGTLVFLDASGDPATLESTAPKLFHQAPDGGLTEISGEVYHSAGHGDQVGLNPGGTVHLRGKSENDDASWTFGFEDSSGGAESDFDDVIFTVRLGQSGANFLNPDYDAAAPMPGADADSHNILVAGDGDDLIFSGAGRDIVDAGPGQDTIHAGPGDTVDGGSGFDTLVLQQTDRIREIRITETLNNSDGSVSKSGFVSYEDCQPDLQFSNIEKIVPCFTPGTRIDTSGGPMLVEHLSPGDRVLTRDHGFQPLKWVGSKELDAGDLARRPEFRPVRIARDSFGRGLPERDLCVSPQHRILLAGAEAELLFGEHEVLVPALHLVGMPGVTRDDGPRVTYVHVMCARHEILRGDGIWSESFQPGDMSLAGLDEPQRGEILHLFPELASRQGRMAYHAARMTLRAHEARALLWSDQFRRAG